MDLPVRPVNPDPRARRVRRDSPEARGPAELADYRETRDRQELRVRQGFPEIPDPAASPDWPDSRDILDRRVARVL